jgi:hypothetical protein
MNMLTPDEAFAVLPVPRDAPELSMGIINRVCPEGYAFTTQWR